MISYAPDITLTYPAYRPPPQSEIDSGEYVDPRHRLKEACIGSCGKWVAEYNRCVARLQANQSGRSCDGPFEELVMCTDHCVAKSLFAYLR